MKRFLTIVVCMLLSVSAFAQQKIQLRSADRAECVKSDMTGLKASFSFSTIEAEDVATKGGEFSWLSMPNTVLGGNEGDPQIPVINELIAVPVGSNPTITVTSYTSRDYKLSELGIKTLIPRQPSLRKDQNPEDVPFVYNAKAYETRGMKAEPQAVVNVVGTMRGVQLGKMTIEPVSYDPVNNIIRVFNDIEVTVHFDGADSKATEDLLVETYSPYFNVVYKQLFNGRAVLDAYSEHPDLYATPVKMLVITTSTYAANTTFKEWVAWKKQKGIYIDVYTTSETGTNASSIKSFIQTQYNQNHPTFLVIVGDSGDVVQSATGSSSQKYTDLYYSSVDGDIFPEIYTSRMPVSSTNELTYMLTKTLQYEQYTMPDPSYLDETLLIAGWDSTWTPKVGKPTIQYANTYYYNSDHGITADVFLTTASGQTTCYNYINQVGFVNYTAHGSQTGWADPSFSVSNVNSMTNTNKYFWAMGNCCLAADWGYSGTCYAEAMVRAQDKGAWGYIGSCPSTYWWEDYYFGVGATSVYNQMPTMDQTQTGVYDAMFDDSGFNTLNAVPFFGNVAVTYSHAGSYDYSVTDQYYWEAYHCLGDGSVMPYQKQPSANNVSHANTINIGVTAFAVSADNGSYVAITKNNEILGAAEVISGNSVNVPISGLDSAGDVMVVVTRQQRQPYIATIQAVSSDGPYISLDSYTPNIALVGQVTDLSLTFKNVGTVATSSSTKVTLTSSDENLVIDNPVNRFGDLASNASITVSGFQFHFTPNAVVGFNYTIHYNAVCGNDTWEGDITVTANQVYTVTVASGNDDYGTVGGGGQYNYGASCTVTATPADGYMFTNWTRNGNVVSTSASYTFTVSEDISLVANFAAGVMIGDGSSSSSEFLPSYNYYNYSLTEQIYTSAELGGEGLITNIAFYNEGAVKTRTYDFYMKNTTKSTFTGATDWITVSSGDKVFSGSVTMVANDWTTITLSTPFVYDGTSNVVLVADDNTGSYTQSPHMSCRVFTATSQALYVYSDGTNYNPNSPSSYSGTVLSTKNQLILTKEPIPTGTFNITVSANPAQAATVTGGGEYQFGETCTVTATPNAGYTFTGWTENGNVIETGLSFSFTATADRNLVANFIQAIEIGEGTANNNFLPSYNYYNYSMTEQIYTADEIGMAGTITCIAFYNEGAAKTRTLDFYLKATDKESFSSKTDWVTVTDSDKVFSGEITMAVNGWTFVIFNTPFEYDGVSNLVLVADDNTGTYTSSPHMACSVYDANGTQSIYIYSDNTNYNPSSPTTDQSSNYATLSVKNHILMGIISSDSYIITATANPTVGGTVDGGGTFEEGESCTLTAIANTGYRFTNWTNNGEVVSTDATYTFNVTASGAYVANFTAIPQYTITIKPNDVEKGSVAFGSKDEETNEHYYDFEDGWQGWTAFKGTEGTSPHNWMHNTEYSAYDSNGNLIVPECHDSSEGMMLSESYISASTEGGGDATAVYPDNYLVSPQFKLGGSFTFYAAARMSNYPAEHFSVLVSETGNSNVSDFIHNELTVTLEDNSWYEYTIDLSAYSGMGYVAIRHYDCYDQHLLYVDDVTIVEPEESDGSVSATFYEGETCTIVATPTEGHFFANWTENEEVVSTVANYTFEVTANHDLVANFVQEMHTQTIELVPGWNWVSFDIMIDVPAEMLSILQEQLGDNVTEIQSMDNSVLYEDGEWFGDLLGIDNTQTYLIYAVNACTVVLESAAEPIVDDYAIEIKQGWNWFGFPNGEELDINEALSEFEAEELDEIQNKNGGILYEEGEWFGDFVKFVPGVGYMYYSNSAETKTLVFKQNKASK